MGEKIKRFARFIMVFGVIACLIAAAYTLITCYDRNLGFWRMNEDIQSSIRIAIDYGLYALCFIFAGMPVYWFGCLFERVEQLQSDVAELKREKNKP